MGRLFFVKLFLFSTIVLVGATQSWGHGCERQVISLPPIVLDGIKTPSDEQLLRESIQSLLLIFKDGFPLPARIHLSNGPVRDTEHPDVLNIRFPYFVGRIDGDDIFTRIEKSPQASVALVLRSVVARLFETYIHHNFDADMPQLTWALWTSIDEIDGLASWQFIEATKKATHLREVDSNLLRQYYSPFARQSVFIKDLIAEMGVILLLGDADAIFKGINFGDDVMAQFRRADIDLTPAHLSLMARGGPHREGYDHHALTAISRVFIWREIYQKIYLAQSSRMTFGYFFESIALALTMAYVDMTNEFDHLPESMRDPQFVNTMIIAHLCREFAIRPCNAPVIGTIIPRG